MSASAIISSSCAVGSVKSSICCSRATVSATFSTSVRTITASSSVRPTASSPWHSSRTMRTNRERARLMRIFDLLESSVLLAPSTELEVPCAAQRTVASALATSGDRDGARCSAKGQHLGGAFVFKDCVQSARPDLKRGAFLMVVAVAVVYASCARAAFHVVQDGGDVLTGHPSFRHFRSGCATQIVAAKFDLPHSRNA